jgi:hypothetical protein
MPQPQRAAEQASSWVRAAVSCTSVIVAQYRSAMHLSVEAQPGGLDVLLTVQRIGATTLGRLGDMRWDRTLLVAGLGLLMVFGTAAWQTYAQSYTPSTEERITALEQRVQSLEMRVYDLEHPRPTYGSPPERQSPTYPAPPDYGPPAYPGGPRTNPSWP